MLCNMPNVRKKRAQNKQNYIQSRESVKAASRAASRADYSADPDKKKAVSLAASRATEQENQIPSSVILLQLSVLSKNLKFEKKLFFTILAIQKPYKYTSCFVKF